MIARPVDSDGDMMPVAYADQMLDKGAAVAQVVKQRLLFYLGEWWEDTEAGFRVPQFLTDGVRQENLQMLVKYISSYVADTEGVDSVDGASVELNKHTMKYKCFVHVGEATERLEVTLDGVLSTQY